MNIERFIGLAFSIGLLLLTLFVFLKPQIDYQQKQIIDQVDSMQKVVPNEPVKVVATEEKMQHIEPVEDVVESSITKSKNLSAMNIKKI